MDRVVDYRSVLEKARFLLTNCYLYEKNEEDTGHGSVYTSDLLRDIDSLLKESN